MANKRLCNQRVRDACGHPTFGSEVTGPWASKIPTAHRASAPTAAGEQKRSEARLLEKLFTSGRSSELRGYVTTAVVSILAILSLLATRVTIGVTVDAYRVAGINQGLTATLYAGEVALKDSVTRISGNLSDLTGNPSCFNHDFGPVTVTDSDSGLSQDYDMQYYVAFIETRNNRDLYRVYATAEISIFKATVSQLVSVDSSAGTVFLLPGTWSGTLLPPTPCST